MKDESSLENKITISERDVTPREKLRIGWDDLPAPATAFPELRSVQQPATQSPFWFQRLRSNPLPFALGICGLLALLGLAAVILSLATSSGRYGHHRSKNSTARSRRILVFVVPGTWGNETFWPNVIPGKATFSSELLQQLPPGSEVRPFLWASDNDHKERLEASRNLAAEIDRDSIGFDEVCLVGHSHGGNVCLLAAGNCRTPIKTVVCLATPHPYLRMKTAEDRECFLPIYATTESLNKIETIISIQSEDDSVNGWANRLPGLSENEAIELTSSWRKELNYPRLQSDNAVFRFVGSSNILVSPELRLSSNNWKYLSFARSSDLEFHRHNAIHSRRMGGLVGTIIAADSPTSERSLIESLVQPSDADLGEPVDAAVQDSWEKQNLAWMHHIGWRLRSATIELHPDAQELENQAGGIGAPDPRLFVTQNNETNRQYETPIAADRMSVSWRNCPCVLFRGDKYSIWLEDLDFLLGSHGLGEWKIDATNPPPKSIDWSRPTKVSIGKALSSGRKCIIETRRGVLMPRQRQFT